MFITFTHGCASGTRSFARSTTSRSFLPSVRSSDVDNFFVDLNGLIYSAARDSFSLYRDILRPKRMADIFSSVIENLNSLINKVRPTKRLFIAVDGVAPKAKMNQQRQRRYKSTRESQDTTLFMKELLGIQQPVSELPNNSICPGSDFMLELIETLTAFILQKIKEDSAWQKVP